MELKSVLVESSFATNPVKKVLCIIGCKEPAVVGRQGLPVLPAIQTCPKLSAAMPPANERSKILHDELGELCPKTKEYRSLDPSALSLSTATPGSEPGLWPGSFKLLAV